MNDKEQPIRFSRRTLGYGTAALFFVGLGILGRGETTPKAAGQSIPVPTTTPEGTIPVPTPTPEIPVPPTPEEIPEALDQQFNSPNIVNTEPVWGSVDEIGDYPGQTEHELVATTRIEAVPGGWMIFELINHPTETQVVGYNQQEQPVEIENYKAYGADLGQPVPEFEGLADFPSQSVQLNFPPRGAAETYTIRIGFIPQDQGILGTSQIVGIENDMVDEALTGETQATVLAVEDINPDWQGIFQELVLTTDGSEQMVQALASLATVDQSAMTEGTTFYGQFAVNEISFTSFKEVVTPIGSLYIKAKGTGQDGSVSSDVRVSSNEQGGIVLEILSITGADEVIVRFKESGEIAAASVDSTSVDPEQLAPLDFFVTNQQQKALKLNSSTDGLSKGTYQTAEIVSQGTDDLDKKYYLPLIQAMRQMMQSFLYA